MKKRILTKLAPLLLIISLLIPIASLASGNNSITIVKLKENKAVGVSGAKYTLWKLSGDYSEVPIGSSEEFSKIFKELQEMSIEDLNKKFGEGEVSQKTDSEGKTTVENLEDGRYYIVETDESGNRVEYSVPSVVDLPTIDKDGKISNSITIYPKETIPLGDVTLTKYKDSNKSVNNLLKDIEFKLYKIDGEERELIKTDSEFKYDPDGGKIEIFKTSDKGVIKITNLPLGKYVFEEVEAPEGYKKEEYPFEITKEELSIKFDAVNIKAPPEIPTGGEKFKKVAENEKGDPLEGAVFKLTTKNDKDNTYSYYLVDGKNVIVKSGKDGYFEVNGLPYGTYYLIETTAPTGYEPLSQPIKLEITEKTYGDGQTKIIVNKKVTPKTPGTSPSGGGGTTPSGGTSPSGGGGTTPSSTKPPATASKVDIPKTGDIQIFLYILSGIGIMAIGLYMYILESNAARS